MIPLFGGHDSKGTFMKLVADAAGVHEEDILGHDLFLYSRMPGTIWGLEMSSFSCGRIDDLQCAFASLKGFLRVNPRRGLRSMPCLIMRKWAAVPSRERIPPSLWTP